MEIQIKKTVKAGNSSAVILPRAWLDKEVRVEIIKKTRQAMLLDIINILNQHIPLENIIGIYLTGSYARRDEGKNSDIDILIITNNIDKDIIKEGIYNILIISSKLLDQKLKEDLLPIGQMIREARPILNSTYIASISIKATKKNIDWYMKTTEDKLKIIKKAIDKLKSQNKKYISDLVAYTLILRIRTLFIINKIIKNEEYSKKEFIKLIRKISGGTNTYEGYLAIKNNYERKTGIKIDEASSLYIYLEKQLSELKKTFK
ncbi:nucleotidyltransferase domain-containing protein [Candidatus Pacearchaeota archaeon]|nr:nucleotidyltransferase domain-containing protein [Candidatus Pacearchaeota archaeon]